MIYAIWGPGRASGVAYNIDKLTNHSCNNATAAAINLDRMTAWFGGRPIAPTRTSRFAALAT